MVQGTVCTGQSNFQVYFEPGDYFYRLAERIHKSRLNDLIDLKVDLPTRKSVLVVYQTGKWSSSLNPGHKTEVCVEWYRGSSAARFGSWFRLNVSGNDGWGVSPSSLSWNIFSSDSSLIVPDWGGEFPVVNPDRFGYFYSVTALESLPLKPVPKRALKPIYLASQGGKRLVAIRILGRSVTAWIDELGFLWVSSSLHAMRCQTWDIDHFTVARLDRAGEARAHCLPPHWFEDSSELVARISKKTHRRSKG